jgi:hypothetical protein
MYDSPTGTRISSIKRNPTTAEDYFRKLSLKTKWNQSEEHYWDVPPTFDDDFFNKCRKEYFRSIADQEDRREWIWTVETILFSKYKYWGDKVLEVETLRRLRDLGLDFKVIYVLRDGRDNVCSRRRYRFGGGASLWYEGVKEWLEFAKKIKPEYCYTIRFEQLISEPLRVLTELAAWIGVDHEPLLSGFYQKVRKNNIGRWKQELPNWRYVFKGEPLVMLRRLNYL